MLHIHALPKTVCVRVCVTQSRIQSMRQNTQEATTAIIEITNKEFRFYLMVDTVRICTPTHTRTQHSVCLALVRQTFASSTRRANGPQSSNDFQRKLITIVDFNGFSHLFRRSTRTGKKTTFPIAFVFFMHLSANITLSNIFL